MIHEVCVDASVVVMWYTPEEGMECALALMDECTDAQIALVAPDCVLPEAASAIRRKVFRGTLDDDEGRVALGLPADAAIDVVPVPRFIWDAWVLAAQYNLPRLYDAYYLALAQLRGCDFWTADERFFSAVAGHPRVKHIGDFAPGCLGG